MTRNELQTALRKQRRCVVCDQLFMASKHFKRTCSPGCRSVRRLINQTGYENGDTISLHEEL